MFGLGGAPQRIPLTLYTDAFVISGTIETRQRRVTDILNGAEDPFLVLSAVTFEEFASTALGTTMQAEFAQVNLASVLFAVAHDVVEPVPELRTPKQPEEALISVPPFKVSGRIHVLPERSLREALAELHGTFIPVTEATYWSDALGEARQTATLVAVNHGRAQILAPHRAADPWAGLPTGSAATTDQGSGAVHAPSPGLAQPPDPGASPASAPRSWADRIDPGAGGSQGGAEPPSKETLGW